jgi:Ku protein
MNSRRLIVSPCRRRCSALQTSIFSLCEGNRWRSPATRPGASPPKLPELLRRYIELDPEELEAVALESKRTIEIEEFVPKSQIDELYIRDPYYIAPDGEVGQQAFAVIREAIRKEGMVAIGKVVFTSREHIIALEARGKGMMGITLRYPYEVRKQSDYFEDIKESDVAPPL